MVPVLLSVPGSGEEHHGPEGSDGDPAAHGAHDDEAITVDDDSLDDLETGLGRLVRRSRGWLAALVVVALVVPSGAWLVDELGFRSSGAAVTAALGDGSSVGHALLLVRATTCDGASATGSAFVLDLGAGPVVVTNRHVVEGAATIGVRRLGGGAALNVVGTRLARDADVAVLEVEPSTELLPLLPSAGRPSVGDAVRLVGFPSGQAFTAPGTIRAVEPSVLRLDLRADPGASGSPVLADDGTVAGQVFARTVDGQGLATPIAVIRAAVATARPAPPC